MNGRKVYQIQAPLVSLTSEQLTYIALLAIMNRVCFASTNETEAAISDELARRSHSLVK